MKRKWARKPFTETKPIGIANLPDPAPIADAPVKNQFTQRTTVLVYLGDKLLGTAENLRTEHPVPPMSDILGRFVVSELPEPINTVKVGGVDYILMDWDMYYNDDNRPNVHKLMIRRAEVRG